MRQRGEWNYVLMEGGGLYVTMNGQISILQWCAGIWDLAMLLEVRYTKRLKKTQMNTLHFPTNLESTYYTSERFGEGTGPIFMDYINCTGSESKLWGKCSHFTHYYGCSHNDDVGIQCQSGI